MLTPWITKYDLADFMAISTPPDGAQLAVDSAMDAVRRYLDQDITYVVDDVELHDGTGKPRIRLRQRPVREVSEVVIDDTTLSEDEYSVKNAFVTLVNGGVFSIGKDNVVVTYDHGWDVDVDMDSDSDDAWALPVPARLKAITLRIARRQFLSFGPEENYPVISEKIGSYEYATDLVSVRSPQRDDLWPDEEAGLERYAVRLYV